MNKPTESKTEQKSVKPGRPAISAAKKREMRRKVAAATQRLFQTEGYRQISMRRIAREVGCSPMTLYKYYDSKVDILHTLWANVFESMFDQLDALALLEESPLKQLTLLASAYVAYWLDNSEHYRLVFMTEGVKQPEVNIFVANPDIAARYNVLALAIINTSSQELSQDDLKQKLDTLICFLNGIAHNLITISGHDWPSSDHLIGAAIACVVDE